MAATIHPADRAIPASGGSSRGNFASAAHGWQLVGPALSVLCVMNFVPLLWSIGMSFYRFRADRPHTPPHFLGLGNYIDLLTDDDIWERVTNTGELILGSVSVQVVVAALLVWRWGRPYSLLFV